ncbi:MAG: hypothetical protein QOD81_3769 [Solirubrobacteraceae bacterium]|nr:hypothetical protein [Solirubrobacteraceae bacterium]
MPGFEFRYRLGGGRPTVRAFRAHDGRALHRGDMLNYEKGAVDLGATGDRSLLGAAVEVVDGDARARLIRAIVDADAVYAVDDAQARMADATLDLTGASGAQGVGESVNADLCVVASCGATDETLVRIADGRHRSAAAALHERLTGGELNAAIARTVVRFHREHTGRGPTRAQAFYRGNVIVVIMHDAMTKAESGLIERGRADVVLEFRRGFQETMREELMATIEALTDCGVEAFMSTIHIDPDMAVEIFVLDRPVPGEPGAGAGDPVA